MHDLEMKTALGHTRVKQDFIGGLSITENNGLALASVAARLGREQDCYDALERLLGAVPEAGRAVLHDPAAGFWTGPDQWMLGAPRATPELLADQLKDLLGTSASVTDQTGAWVCFDITGPAMPDLCERLCNVPIRQMQAGDAQRTMIHHMGCFVLRRTAADHIRLLGARSFAGSLHHALIEAAHSIA